MLKKKSKYLDYNKQLFDVQLSEPYIKEYLLYRNIEDNGLVMFIRPRPTYKPRYEVYISKLGDSNYIYVSGNVKSETVLSIADRYNICLEVCSVNYCDE